MNVEKDNIREVSIAPARYKIFFAGKFVGVLDAVNETLTVFRDNEKSSQNLKLPEAVDRLRFSLIRVCIGTGRDRRVHTYSRYEKLYGKSAN
jgi:hypothetical protein